MKLLVDPGHGQGTGATARDEFGALLVEDTQNYLVAKELEIKLEAAGHEVMLSRAEDENPTLGERARRAANYGAELTISIHHNIGEERYAKTELYHYWCPQLIPPPPTHPGLATPFNRVRVYDVQNNFESWMGRAKNVVYLHFRQGIPAVLVECGYLNAPDHQKVIQTKEYPSIMASALSSWICAKIRRIENGLSQA
jgi:N-acetylmuramoyl-L-alanine amidase